MPTFTATAQAVTARLHNNGLIESFDMIEQGTVARIITASGHIVTLSTEIHEGEELALCTIYAPGDTAMIDGAVDMAGFEIISEDRAVASMTKIVAQY